MSLDISSLPKVELHVHLEGTIAAETALELAHSNGVDPSSLPFGPKGYPTPFTSFEHFVEIYLTVSALIKTPDDLATVAAAFAATRAPENIAYTEVTFTANTHVANGMEPRAMWEAVRSGLAEAGDGREIHLIVDAVRNKGPQDGPETVALVEAADAPIVGLGLTGIEGSVPEGEFAMLREAADRLGMGLAVHAGEAGTPSNVTAALDIGADRIGHGVASVQDDALVERLVRERIPVEVCPSSNVILGLFPSLAEHPLPEMWRRGINVLINSDDPPFFSTSLTDDLGHAIKLLELRAGEVAELQRRAARAAFAPEETKARLLAEIDAWETSVRQISSETCPKT